MTDLTTTELDLQGFLRIVRQRAWVVILVPLVVAMAAGVAASLRTPLYRSSADILIAPTQAESAFSAQNGGGSDPRRVLKNQIRIIQSQRLMDLVKQRLGFHADVAATASDSEDVISLSAVSPDASRAASVVDAYASAYLDYRRSTSATQNATIQAEVRRQIESIEGQLKSLDDQLSSAGADQQNILRTSQASEREALAGTLSTKRAELDQLESAANVEEGGAQLLVPPSVPRSPFEPRPLRSGILGLAFGVIVAMGLVLLLDYLDNRIRTKDDLARAAGNLPVVGVIPAVPGRRQAQEAHVISLDQPTSPSAEAYRTLRTAIQFLRVDRSLQTLLITSAARGEGKTTTVVNLAVALARAGQKVVVVDGDLRRPRVHSFFKMSVTPGLTSVLLGEASLSNAIRPVPGLEGLFVLPAGPVPPNPSELLAGTRMAELLERVKAQADVLVIDSPPLLPVADAAVMATRVDGTLIVVGAHRTLRKQLARAVELLRQVDAPVIGTVFNWVGQRDDDSYSVHGYELSEMPSRKSARRRNKSPKPSDGRPVSNGAEPNGSSAPKERPARATKQS